MPEGSQRLVEANGTRSPSATYLSARRRVDHLLPTGTLLVMFATVFVAFERIGTAAVVGGVGVWLLLN